jgi:phosphoribosylglycinamide formyltransferase 1
MNVAIFASGSGSNAENIYHYFAGHPEVRIGLILTNKSDAGVVERAQRLGIPYRVFDRAAFNEGEVVQLLQKEKIDWVVLAGFLWRIPVHLVQAFEGKMVNIHPALLPKFGGSGMYGDRVHQAVVAAGETQTGITIHWVNEDYDEGKIIFQAQCPVSPSDTYRQVAEKVHALEYEHFPKVLESLWK